MDVVGLSPRHRLCSFSGTCELIVEQLRAHYSNTVCYQCVRVLRLWRPACLYTSMADRVLIIDDDDAVNRCLPGLSLGKWVSGRLRSGAGRSANAARPFLIFCCDHRSPAQQTRIRRIRSIKYVREGSLQTRIIVLTAYGWPELKAEASAAGADVFLRKPLRLKELGKTVVELAGASA